MTGTELYDPLLFGADAEPGLVAVELLEGEGGDGDQVVLFSRRDGQGLRRTEPFQPFFLLAGAERMKGYAGRFTTHSLQGPGALNVRVDVPSWKECQKARGWLARTTRSAAGAPDAPYYVISDPIQQHLLRTGRTLFKGMRFGDLRRLQVDIECLTAAGFEFCNPQREEDRIVAIALADSSGWVQVLSGADCEEAELLRRFVALVQERDPDVIEGHNIYNFDLPYLAARARRHGVPLALGRDGREPETRPSRFSIGERTLSYTRFDLFGRHVVDTLFLTHAYDITHRSLAGYGLKEVAAHFGLSAPDRTTIEGAEISAQFRSDPERLMRYAAVDVKETRGLSALLSPSVFLQAQMLPFSYQNACVRGNATKIDSLLVREYLRQSAAVPRADTPRSFEGGYTDLFLTGVVNGVHHCDVRSLYPSLMLQHRIGPATDGREVFLRLLDRLRTFRLDTRRRMAEATGDERAHWEALQTTFKVLINSFYGYLGFDQAHFSDFAAAERVTAEGRSVLRGMIDWLREHGARPVEIDTDGVYFVPPPGQNPAGQERFRSEFRGSLPDGIEVEFDGEYRAMFSYRRKNYALLTHEGEILITGGALKSRGLERFQRDFLRDVVRCKLEGREEEILRLKEDYARKITERQWPIRMLAKTESLQDAPATYAAKIGRGARARNAAYELALRSGREYRAGDPVSYYVTGTRKDVPVHSHAKLVSEWDPQARDENVAYYEAKLQALYDKFTGGSAEDEDGGGE